MVSRHGGRVRDGHASRSEMTNNQKTLRVLWKLSDGNLSSFIADNKDLALGIMKEARSPRRIRAVWKALDINPSDRSGPDQLVVGNLYNDLIHFWNQ